jgi:hypothetical protein
MESRRSLIVYLCAYVIERCCPQLEVVMNDELERIWMEPFVA